VACPDSGNVQLRDTVCAATDELAGNVYYDILSTDQRIFSWDDLANNEVDYGDTVVDLSSSNLTERYAAARGMLRGFEIIPQVQELRAVIIDFTLFQADTRSIATVRLMSYFNYFGAAVAKADVQVIRPFTSRFPPNQWYILVACIMLATELGLLYRAASHRGFAFSASWSFIDASHILHVAFFTVAIALDVTSYIRIRSLNLNLNEGARYVPMRPIVDFFRVEMDFLSFLFYVYYTRCVRPPMPHAPVPHAHGSLTLQPTASHPPPSPLPPFYDDDHAA